MARILIIADVPGWAYERRAKALQKNAPDGFEVDIQYSKSLSGVDSYDLVFNLEYSLTPVIKALCKKTLLVNSHNADHRRVKDRFEMSLRFADFVIMNNQEAFDHYGRVPKTCNISNGVDFDEFYPVRPIGNRRNYAVWTGTEAKGYREILCPLQDRFDVRGGDRGIILHPIRGSDWDSMGNPIRHRVWDTATMRAWCNSARVVLCSSVTEATPNYVLEAMACGLVPVTTRVGNLMEFGEHESNCVFVDRNIKAFERGIDYAFDNIEEMSANVLESLRDWSWIERSKLFFRVFELLISGVTPKPFCYKELTNGRID